MHLIEHFYFILYSQLPKLPTTLYKLTRLKNMESKTIKGDDFLLVNNNEIDILGFLTVRNLQALYILNMIFVDGTFKNCPK